MSNQPKLNAEQICYRAKGEIDRYLVPATNPCKLSQDESGRYFVFELTHYLFNQKESGRLTVLAAMIEDGIISEQQLLAALWHALLKVRGVA